MRPHSPQVKARALGSHHRRLIRHHSHRVGQRGLWGWVVLWGVIALIWLVAVRGLEFLK